MVKAPLSFLVGCIGRFMALEAAELLDLAQFHSGIWLGRIGHVVVFSLKILLITLVIEDRCSVGNLPVIADGNGMALVTSSRGGYRSPGAEHGTTATENHGQHKQMT